MIVPDSKTILAQSGGAGGVVVWLLVLAVVVIGAAVGLLTLRKRILRDDEQDAGDLSLHDLRRLRAEGRLSEEEYKRLHDAMIQAARPRERHAHVEQLAKRREPPKDAQ